MNPPAPEGISVILCCFNSAERINKTLLALSHQQFNSKLQWEILVVDNASTDDTAAVAQDIWMQLKSSTPLRIISEPLPGLGHARKKGVAVATYAYVLFCDDDNWLEEHYVQGVYDILSGDHTIAACGGMGLPVFETKEPFWFYEYAEAFAVGSQAYGNENGKLRMLYGAGMGVRKKVLDNLYRSGFKALLAGRTGATLSSSEDTELTAVFVLQGYKLVYTDELKFYHFLPQGRLSFAYLKKLFSAFGKDGPVLNLYYSYMTKRVLHQRIRHWPVHVVVSLYRLFKYLIVPPKRFGRWIYFAWNINYIRQLFAIRSHYRNYKNVIEALTMTGVAKPHFSTQEKQLPLTAQKR